MVAGCLIRPPVGVLPPVGHVDLLHGLHDRIVQTNDQKVGDSRSANRFDPCRENAVFPVLGHQSTVRNRHQNLTVDCDPLQHFLERRVARSVLGLDFFRKQVSSHRHRHWLGALRDRLLLLHCHLELGVRIFLSLGQRDLRVLQRRLQAHYRTLVLGLPGVHAHTQIHTHYGLAHENMPRLFFPFFSCAANARNGGVSTVPQSLHSC